MRKVLFIFGQLTEGDVDWLAESGRKRAVAAGETLIRQGTAADSVFIVLDGKLSVTIPGRTLATIASGELVGEMSFLDSRPPAASVTAAERSTVLAIPRARLADKLREDPGFAARFYHALGILLAYRLRNHDLGYSAGQPLAEDATYDDELDPDLLDLVSLAGTRFDGMRRRLGA